MNEYIVHLTEHYSNQIFHDLKDFGLEVTWVSNALTNVIAVKTDKKEKELEQHSLIETAYQPSEGSFN